MDRKQVQIILSCLCLFLGIVACALPGQTTQTQPVNDSGVAETSIAGTMQAAQHLTEQAGLVTPTPTVVPTETPIPTPQISLNGTSLQFREDQSAEFIDHKAGIKLIIPPGWLPVRLNEDEYYKAFTLDVVLANQEITNRLTRIQSADANFFRLDAIDIRDGHIHDGIISDINVIFQEGDVRSLEKWAEAEKNEDHLLADFKLISSSYHQTANGIRVLVMEESWASAQTNTIYYRGVFFSLPTGTVVLDFYSNFEVKDSILPDFEQVVDSLIQVAP